MTAQRSRKEEITYRKYRANNKTNSTAPECTFCALKKGDYQVIKVTKHSKVVRNIFAYSIWDGQKVVDHLMIIPKRHTDTLSDLNDQEALDNFKLTSTYESKGYNLYSRAPQSNTKTILHQHTHLIKTHGVIGKFLFLLKKPYVRISL